MTRLELAKTVVVLDLDDTLYSEADYLDSGIRHVCDRLQELCGIHPYAAIQAQQEKGKLDWLEFACQYAGLPGSAKESLLWMYRLHAPTITVSASCKQALTNIRAKALAVAVLTDGRSITQRQKLKALGLTDLPAFISEDYDSEKPEPLRYQAIERLYPAGHYVYIGDNVKKDFIACNALGWSSIGLRGNARNIHTQVVEGVQTNALPSCWINDWDDLSKLFF